MGSLLALLAGFALSVPSVQCGPYSDTDPAWSRQGTIAFVRDVEAPEASREAALFTIRADGRSLRRLTGPKVHFARRPVWSPDGRLIAFFAFGSFRRRLLVVDADGTGLRQLHEQAEDTSLRDLDLSWSPDGNELAFVVGPVGRHRIAVADVNAGTVREITRETADSVQPAWSPDGRTIASVASGTQIRLVDVATGAGRTIGDDRALVSDPAWSPDGTEIAYASAFGPNVPDIHVVAPDGSGDRVIARYGETPAWSPDGTRIAYSTATEGGPPPAIAVARADEMASFHPITHTESDFRPAWSPDGGTLVFQSTRHQSDGGFELRLIGADGRSERRLTYHCLLGTARGERLTGTRFDDVIVGRGGRDVLIGLAGNDRIEARDGERDVVSCGPGRDNVLADRRDRVARDCESVRRR